ncbi:MAG: hypothetical protein FJ240_12230 [Nitrospira sp.]|nr:hypothetical protein [Nitrospira sp.]
MTEDVIIGTAVGYTVDDVKPFVLSLIHSGYKGKTILFIDNLNSNTAIYLQNHNTELCLYEHGIFPLNSQRYFLYKQFLDAGNIFKRVMLTDIRDVIFQCDPFMHFSKDTLDCFEEDRSMTLATCPYNGLWILQAYGEAVLNAIGHKPIICAGVTIGSYRKVCEYLDILCKELVSTPPLWGIDQAAHNFIIRSGKISEVIVHDNQSGPVYTLGYVRKENIRINSDGFILNASGTPCIIHQYDRHTALQSEIQKKYANEK